MRILFLIFLVLALEVRGHCHERNHPPLFTTFCPSFIKKKTGFLLQYTALQCCKILDKTFIHSRAGKKSSGIFQNVPLQGSPFLIQKHTYIHTYYIETDIHKVYHDDMRHLHHPKWVTPRISEGMSWEELANFSKILHISPISPNLSRYCN